MFRKRVDEMARAGKKTIVAGGQARTVRMLTKADDVGFGLSDVHLAAGTDALVWLKHHRQANHIISGIGEVTDLVTGRIWKLGPSMAYNVGRKDRHRVRAHTAMHVVSMFCPPLVGHEQHDADGVLAPSESVPPDPPQDP